MSLIYVNEDYLVGDLVNGLVKWEHCLFEGANPKHIKVQHNGRYAQRGVPLASTETTDKNPLLCGLIVIYVSLAYPHIVVLLENVLDGELLQKFNV